MHCEDQPKPAKRSRSSDEDMEGNAYIPDLTNGTPHMTITFSLKDKKGALARILKPFEVKKYVYSSLNKIANKKLIRRINCFLLSEGGCVKGVSEPL